MVCVYRSAGFSVAAESIDTDDIRVALLNRFMGESAILGAPLDVLGGTMQPFYEMAYSEGVPIGSWSVAWARDGVLLLLATRYDERWAPDEAADIAIAWLNALIPTMLDNLAAVDADTLAQA